MKAFLLDGGTSFDIKNLIHVDISLIAFEFTEKGFSRLMILILY